MLDHIAQELLALLSSLAALVLLALAWVENVFGNAMTAAHIPHSVQTVIGIVVAVLFLLAAIQMFSGFIRVVVIVVLLAIVVHAVEHPGPLPAGVAGNRNTLPTPVEPPVKNNP